MSIIEQMLTGQMEMREFITLLESDEVLQNAVKSLIPVEAIDHPAHPLWATVSFDTNKRHQFDLLLCLHWLCKFDNTLGDNLNIFGTIRRFYTYTHPDLVCTDKYDKAYDLLLDVTKDCFEGSEVNDVIEKIINDALQLKTKKQRIQYAKQEINTQFHVEGTNRPRWIQGADWPMGKNSPMQYISKKCKGEAVIYLFQDVDTGETREVIQYY